MLSTPYERTGSVTTFEAAQNYYAELAADTPRVRTRVLAHSGQGRPVTCLTIGAPDVDPTGGVLIVGSQHGNERAAREAPIELARDLAYTTDPALIAYLDAHPVQIIPMLAPDGVVALTRSINGAPDDDTNNANRDYMAFRWDETYYSWLAMIATDVHVLVDCHEHWNPTYLDITFGIPNAPSTDPDVVAASDQLRQEIIDHVISETGHSAGPYLGLQSGPTGMRAAAGMTGRLAILIETNASDPGNSLPYRIESQTTALHAIVRYHASHREEIAATKAVSRLARRRAGAAQEPFPLGDGQTLSPGPTGYWLDDPDAPNLLARQVAGFGLHLTPSSGGWRVVMASEQQPVIPYLFDPDSPFAVLAGKRLGVFPPPVEVVGLGPLRIDGSDVEVLSIGR